jgi:PIN domain nuclease of toxin-antitoxin system
VRLLLDTHVLIWWSIDDSRLSKRARSLILEANEVLISAASAWEIATKVRLGKLEWTPSAGNVGDYVRAQGFRPLPIQLEHAERAGALPGAHRDPFDRMLIAQALIEGVPIATTDEAFERYGVERCW